MGCNCGKRGKLLGAAAKAIRQGKPVAPIVRGIGRTVKTDARAVVKALNPKIGRR